MLYKLKRIIKKGQIKINEPLKNHTSFKIGGNAKFLVLPNDEIELIDLINYLSKNNKKYYILGNGTNVLANDNGFNGVIIKTTNLNKIRQYNNYLEVFAGVTINQFCNYCKCNNLSGFEDAFGIPGTIGGAVVMNASAYEFKMSNFVLGVLCLIDGKVDYLANAECEFGYRKSAFNNAIVLRVDLKLENKECDVSRMNYIMQLRKTFQPLNLPSAGSVFKRCDGVIVSKLLDDLGFKGRCVGGAMISKKHAGFIVNNGNATAADVKMLISNIKKEVKSNKNIILEEEIKYLD